MGSNWQEFLMDNMGKILGAAGGFLFGLLVIILGFFQAFFVIVCTFLGFYLGMRKDDREDIFKILERFIPHGNSRR